MTTTLVSHTGKPYRLDVRLGGGGEGDVYAVAGLPSHCAKIYRPEVRASRHAKVRAMIAAPPRDPMRNDGAVSIAWPSELLYQSGSQGEPFVGYVMPRARPTARPLAHYLGHDERLTTAGWCSWRHLHRLMANLSAAMAAVHEAGHCVGDVNDTNALVLPDMTVCLVDTDSFQVTGMNKQVFPCEVASILYLAPELIAPFERGELARTRRGTGADNMSLAALIYRALLLGGYPFRDDDRAQLAQLQAVPVFGIAGSGGRPSGADPAVLAPELRALFGRAFGTQGVRHPPERPSADEWSRTLHRCSNALSQCHAHGGHYVYHRNQPCPWCARAERTGIDPFPSGFGWQAELLEPGALAKADGKARAQWLRQFVRGHARSGKLAPAAQGLALEMSVKLKVPSDECRAIISELQPRSPSSASTPSSASARHSSAPPRGSAPASAPSSAPLPSVAARTSSSAPRVARPSTPAPPRVRPVVPATRPRKRSSPTVARVIGRVLLAMALLVVGAIMLVDEAPALRLTSVARYATFQEAARASALAHTPVKIAPERASTGWHLVAERPVVADAPEAKALRVLGPPESWLTPAVVRVTAPLALRTGDRKVYLETLSPGSLAMALTGTVEGRLSAPEKSAWTFAVSSTGRTGWLWSEKLTREVRCNPLPSLASWAGGKPFRVAVSSHAGGERLLVTSSWAGSTKVEIFSVGVECTNTRSAWKGTFAGEVEQAFLTEHGARSPLLVVAIGEGDENRWEAHDLGASDTVVWSVRIPKLSGGNDPIKGSPSTVPGAVFQLEGGGKKRVLMGWAGSKLQPVGATQVPDLWSSTRPTRPHAQRPAPPPRPSTIEASPADQGDPTPESVPVKLANPPEPSNSYIGANGRLIIRAPSPR